MFCLTVGKYFTLIGFEIGVTVDSICVTCSIHVQQYESVTLFQVDVFVKTNKFFLHLEHTCVSDGVKCG